MISSSRVLTVVRKDMAWAMGNMKLLGVMLLPLFAVVFFSRFDAAATFGFSMVFVNAFVGIFSTSYLVIEEKNKGTLLALLTSPLTGAELLLGKFLFNLLLCSTFSVLVIVLNQRWDLFVQPLALLNIILFAGTTCFVGFVIGIFFKNEQEMSVLAPFLMVLFVFGGAAEKVADENNVHAFFPDYQMAQSVRDIPLTSADLWPNTLLSLLMFSVAFAMATFYTGFYFSNNREKRYSNRLVGFIFAFLLVLVSSAVVAHNRRTAPAMEEGLEVVEFSSPEVQVRFRFNPGHFKRKPLLQSQRKTIELLSFAQEKEASVVVAVRDLEDDESDTEMRSVKVRKDPRRALLGAETLMGAFAGFQQWVYTKEEHFILLREKICNKQIFQVSYDVPLKKAGRIPKDVPSYEEVFNKVEMQCLTDTE